MSALNHPGRLLLLGCLLAMQAPAAHAVFLHGQDGAFCPGEPPVRPAKTIATASAVTNPLVRVAYILPTNRVEQVQAVERIQLVVTMAQDWFRDQMVRHGYGPRTFQIETLADGMTPRVHIVKSTEPDTYFQSDVWGRTIEQATANGLPVWTAGQVWLLIPETHIQSTGGSLTGTAALGASWGSGDDPGVAMMGGDALARFRPEFLTNNAAYGGMIIPEVGPYALVQGVTFASFEGSTLSAVSSSVIGALMHELGHAFGLPHDFRNDDNFRGNLMGNGCRGIRGSFFPARYTNDAVTLNTAMARVLSLSRYFGAPGTDTQRPAVTLLTSTNVSVMPQQGEVAITFEASDNQNLAAAWLDWNDTTIADMELSGTQTNVTIKTTYFNPGQNNQYRLCVWDRSGNRHDINFTLPVLPLPLMEGSVGPRPKLVVKNATGFPGRAVALDADGSTISGNRFLAEFTFLVEGPAPLAKLEIGPTNTPVQSIILDHAGHYTASVRVRDAAGFEARSLPVVLQSHQPELVIGKSGVGHQAAIAAYGPEMLAMTGNANNQAGTLQSTRLPGSIITLSDGIVLERAESWTNGTSLNGWVCSKFTTLLTFDQNHRLSVTNESLAVTFPVIGASFDPTLLALHMVATSNSSGGRLHGNVAATAATHLALDFYCDVVPARLSIGLRRENLGSEGTLFYYTPHNTAIDLIDPTLTTGWNRIYVPLRADRFTLYGLLQPNFPPPYDDEFQATLENITHLFVTLERSSTADSAPAEQYRINHVRWTYASIRLEDGSAEHPSGAVLDGTIEVNSTIHWTATVSDGWVTLNSASGTGDGVITYTVAPNVDNSPRTATITITGADQSAVFTITQAGRPVFDFATAWPSALGFRYEIRFMTSPAGNVAEALTLIGRDGNGAIIEQGLVADRSDGYYFLKVSEKE